MGAWNMGQRSCTESSLADPENCSDDNTSDEEIDNAQSALLQLPSEIIDQILTHLQVPSLVSLTRTSRLLKAHAENPLLWATLLRRQLPPSDFPENRLPAESYRSLYISHHPYWFLPRYKIWFSDEAHTGKVILVKFDPRRGCIEGYRLVADRGEPNFIAWSYDSEVTIHTFDPKPSLWLGDPVLKLEQDPATARSRQGWWDGEIQMRPAGATHNIFSTFFLTRALPDPAIDQRMELWPPLTIPGMPRVRSASQDSFQGWGHKPQKFEEISDTTFRLRKWIQFSVGGSNFGLRMGDEVSTWSTLRPEMYTPTKEKPYQGIYVGDYAGHGCEFLLIMQTDKAPEPPPQPTESRFYTSLPASATSHDGMRLDELDSLSGQMAGNSGSYEEESIYKGSIEAIKLTGDPYIPRGEHTFIADDIGAAGYIRTAWEAPFVGARIVKCRGHVAVRGFLNDEFLPSQLIMMSHNKLAQYWCPFKHISFYERVDIDGLLDGCNYRDL